MLRSVDGGIDLGADLVDMILSIEISSNDVISLDELIKLPLQVLVLLGEQEGMLL